MIKSAKSVCAMLIVAGFLSACSQEPEPVYECSKLTDHQTILLNKSFDTCMQAGNHPSLCSKTTRKTYCTLAKPAREELNNALQNVDRFR